MDLKKHLTSFAKIFKQQSFNSLLINNLKKISIPTNQVCVKELESQSAVYCKDCGICPNSIICLSCYEKSKEKHKNHKIIFKNLVGGCCDCGNPLAWDKKGFCSEHKGIFSDDKQIENYLKQCFKTTEINQINFVLNNLIKYLVPIFLRYEEENKLNNDDFINLFEEFMDFIIETSEANLGILHLISSQLLKNHKFETKHNCCIINREKNIFEIKNYKGVKHNCICPFIKLILTCWTNEDKIQALFLFLHNYKLKEYLGYIMIMYYPKIYKNNCESIFQFTCQIFISSIIENVIKNKIFLNGMFAIIYTNLKEIISSKNNFDILLERIQNFRYDIFYLIQINTKNIFNHNFDIYKYMIDIFNLLHYVKTFNSKIDDFTYCENARIVFYIENYLLDIFSTLISLIDFNEEGNKMKMDIFNYLVLKILNKKMIEINYFSPHIPLIRAFSILLNNLCFNDVIYNKRNLLESIQFYFNKIEKKEIFNQILIKNLFQVIGFILSLNYQFFIYYDSEIRQYLIYFNLKIISLSDFVLLRYLFSLDENKNYFTLDNILSQTSINNSSKIFIEQIYQCKENNLQNLNLDLNDEDELKKNMNFNSLIISFIFSIIRNIMYEIDLFMFSYNNLDEHKIISDSINHLYENEKKEIIKIVELKIIILLLSKENFSNYSEIFELFDEFYVTLLGEEKVKEIFLNMTEKRVLNNEKICYSLKNEIIKKFDIDFENSIFIKSKIERYLIEDKNDIFCILNTIIYPSLKIENDFLLKIYSNFFFNHINFISIIKIIKGIIQNKNLNVLQSIFLSKLMKIICVYIKICKSNPNFEKEISFKTNISDLFKVLDFISQDNNFSYKNLAIFLQKEISDYLDITFIENSNETKDDNLTNISKKKLSIKEKLKQKFKEKNKIIEKKFNEILKEDENNDQNINEKICLLCRKPILNDENDGKIGFYASDFFLSNTILHTIKKEFNKFKLNIKFNDYYKIKKEKNSKFFSCNHMFHYDCYLQYVNNNILNYFFWKTEVYCPYCKILSNIFIPNFNPNDSILYKGFKFNDIIEFNNNKFKLKKNLNFNLNDEFQEKKEILIKKSNNFIDKIIEYFSNGIHILESLNSNQELLNNYYSIFEKEFDNFLLYYDLIEDKNEQIEIWSIIIISLRIVLRNSFKIENLNIENLCYFLNLSNNDFNLNILDNFYVNFGKFLFNFLIFCDNIEEELKYILNLCSPYISLIAFLNQILQNNNFQIKNPKIEYSQIANFIKSNENNNKTIIDNIFKSYLNKSKIAYLIQLKIQNKTPISENEYLLFNIKEYENKSFYSFIFDFNINNPLYKQKVSKNIILKNIVEKINKEKILILTPNLLLNTLKINFSFIKLSSNLLDLASKYVNEKCIGCQKSGSTSILCLICEKKMCETNCKILNKNEYTIINHINNCNGGCICCLFTKNGEINFYYNNKIISSKKWAYLNNLGDQPETYGTISNEYLLKENVIKICEKLFINYSFRK